MKLSIVYFSKTGKTREMAEVIAGGMRTREGAEVRLFDLEEIDKDFLNDSKAVVFGTPTWVANTCWQMKKWLDESSSKGYALGGKIGSVFATANYIQGGADTAITTIVHHLLVKGMLVYSGGAALGQPFIHLGAVAVTGHFEEAKGLFDIYGQRIADKALELFRQ